MTTSCSLQSRASVRTSASASSMPVFGENSAAVARDVRLARADERLVHDLEAFDAVGDRRACRRLERLHLVSSCATISLPLRRCGTSWCAQNS